MYIYNRDLLTVHNVIAGMPSYSLTVSWLCPSLSLPTTIKYPFQLHFQVLLPLPSSTEHFENYK